MKSNFVVISADPALISFLNKNFEAFLSFDSIQNIEQTVDPTKQPIVLDLRQSTTQSIKSILQHLSQHYPFAKDSVILITSFSFLYDNVYFDKYPFLFDIIAMDKNTDLRLVKRISSIADPKALKNNKDQQLVKDAEYQKIMYQLNEIFMFEENLQLDFFEMDISNVVQLILNKISNSLANEICLFFSYDKKEAKLSLSSASKKTMLGEELVIELEKYSELSRFVEKQMPQLDNDVKKFPMLYKELIRKFKIEPQTAMIIPVFRQEEMYGCILALNKKYNRFFADLDLTFTQITANKIDQVLDQKRSWHQFANDGNTVNQELATERDVLREILNKMEFAIVIFSKTDKVFFYNEMVSTVLGTSAKNEATTLQELFTDEVVQLIKESSLEAVHGAIKREFVVKSGERRYITVGCTVSTHLITEINELGFIVTFKDITSAENSKENMFRVDKLASLGVLASGIAHEIRNPLAGIRTMAETLSGELENDDQREYTDRIIRQVIRLSSLLKSFFSFAKPARPEKKETALPLLFKEIFPLVKNKLTERGINLTEYYEQELDKIFVDPNQIEQVLFNVFLNAIDAMPNGGELFFSAKPATNFNKIINRTKYRFKLTDTQYVEISIRDTGVGMDEETVNIIFDPFYTNKAEGTGLGLSIVHQIITEHDGLIDISSEVGEGTDFRIYLPIGGTGE